MKIATHRRFEELRRRLAQCPELLQRWDGVAYRVTSLDYPDPASILQGEGSYRYGGRWNAIGSFRAVYGSTQDTVAVAESRANAEYAGIAYPFRAPRLLVAVELSLRSVLDLTSAAVCRALNVKNEELRQEDWRKVQEEGAESLTQALGRSAFVNGAEGLLAFSARIEEGVNVVYFPKNRRDGSRVSVLEPEKLERFARLAQ